MHASLEDRSLEGGSTEVCAVAPSPPLSVSDHVVAPGVGLGQITGVEAIEVAGSVELLYRMEFEGGLRMWVPFENTGAMKLRCPMSAAEGAEALDIIRLEQAPGGVENWNRRQRRHSEMLMSNEPACMAHLLGELAVVFKARRADRKSVSLGEQRTLRRTWALLAAELAVVLGEGAEAIEARLRAATGLELAALRL